MFFTRKHYLKKVQMTENTTEEQELNLTQAAELAGYTAQTLLYHIKTHGVPHCRVLAGRKLFKPQDILNWKAAHAPGR